MSIIRGVEYNKLNDLLKDYDKRWRLFFSLLSSQDKELCEFIKTQDREKYNKIIEVPVTYNKPDEYLFKIAAIINSHSDLIYHDYRFKTIEEYGKKIIKFSPKIDVYLRDLLKNGLLLEYMKWQKMDIEKPAMYKKISEYMDIENKYANIGYFLCGFYFNGNKNIKYNSKIYKDYNHFVNSIITDENINEVADSFQKDCFIISWQISSNNDDLSIYERFLHVINMFDEKKRTYLKELKIEKNIG